MTQSPKSFAKHFLAIYKGDASAAIRALESSRDVREPYWAEVRKALDAAR